MKKSEMKKSEMKKSEMKKSEMKKSENAGVTTRESTDVERAMDDLLAFSLLPPDGNAEIQELQEWAEEVGKLAGELEWRIKLSQTGSACVRKPKM